MKLASYFLLWALACKAAAGFDEKEPAIVPEENANEHLRGLYGGCHDRQCCHQHDGHPCQLWDKCMLSPTCQDHECEGTPRVCDPPAQCKEDGVCRPWTGGCHYDDSPYGTSCVSDNMCAAAAECQYGNCEATAFVPCAPPAQCPEPGVCDPLTGVCSYATSPNGTPCDDGNAATPGDVCVDGVCTCTAGICCGKANETPCNTGNGNKCYKQSKCLDEVCELGPMKVCAPPTQCKVVIGGCNPATGFCTFEKKLDGTPCNDGKATTKNDQCVNGFCVGTPI